MWRTTSLSLSTPSQFASRSNVSATANTCQHQNGKLAHRPTNHWTQLATLTPHTYSTTAPIMYFLKEETFAVHIININQQADWNVSCQRTHVVNIEWRENKVFTVLQELRNIFHSFKARAQHVHFYFSFLYMPRFKIYIYITRPRYRRTQSWK